MAGTKKPGKKGKDYSQEQIGARIKSLRLKLGEKSSEIFAYKIGMDRKQYGNYERGADMRMSTFFRLCEALEVTPEEFFKGVE